jgi:hypothetical protein
MCLRLYADRVSASRASVHIRFFAPRATREAL